MMAIKRYVLPVTLLVISILLATKGFELRSLGTGVDGTGIGISFLSVEINDSVQEQNIPSYSFGFFASSLLTFLIAFVLYLTTTKLNKVKAR